MRTSSMSKIRWVLTISESEARLTDEKTTPTICWSPSSKGISRSDEVRSMEPVETDSSAACTSSVIDHVGQLLGGDGGGGGKASHELSQSLLHELSQSLSHEPPQTLSHSLSHELSQSASHDESQLCSWRPSEP